MWDAKKKIDELNKKNEHQYDDYLNEHQKILTAYNNKISLYNNQINIINSEKLAMREELKKLYSFLKYIGLVREISIIDFIEEKPALSETSKLVTKLDRVEADDDWGVAHFINIANAEKFEEKIEKQSAKYIRDLSAKKIRVKRMQDYEEIAKLYRDIIVTIRDTIREKVLPEFEYLRAFLIADAIREKVLLGDEIIEIKPCKIMEYKNTKYNAHYIFVKNTFDFWDLAKAFFSRAVLTELLEKGEITQKERADFEKSVYELRGKINLLAESAEVSRRE